MKQIHFNIKNKKRCWNAI